MKKKIIVAVIIFSLASVLLFVFYHYIIRSRNAVEKLIQEKKMINIVVAGAGTYKDNKHRFYAMVSINPDNNNIGITFIPPSYRIFLNSDGSEIDAIENIEFSDFSKIKNTIYKDLKIQAQFFCLLYNQDVERIVDLIEGVDIFILDQMKNMDNLSFGLNYLDGKKIIRYINDVEQNSIYLKYDRIQDILLTLFYGKGLKNSFLSLEFITEMFKNIKTNLLPQELLTLGEIMFKDGYIYTSILPGTFEKKLYVIDDIAYRIYEKDFLSPLIMEEEGEMNIKVKIVNGTDVPGLARKLRNDLNREGFNVMEFGTSPYPRMNKSILINRKGNYSAVRKLSELTGITTIYNVIDNTQLNNVLIIVGQDMAK